MLTKFACCLALGSVITLISFLSKRIIASAAAGIIISTAPILISKTYDLLSIDLERQKFKLIFSCDIFNMYHNLNYINLLGTPVKIYWIYFSCMILISVTPLLFLHYTQEREVRHMYKYQIKRLLKNHFPLLLIIIFLAAAGKIFAINISKNIDDLSQQSQNILDSYVRKTISYSSDERLSFISEEAQNDAEKFSAVKSPSQEQIDDYSTKSNAHNAYRNSLVYNAYTLLGVQNMQKQVKDWLIQQFPKTSAKLKMYI